MAYQYASPNWKIRARIWIVVIFVMLCGADYLMLTFARNPFNPVPQLLGLAILTALCSKVMLIGMWRRRAWSRYALIALLTISLLVYGVAMFMIFGTKIPRTSGMWKKPMGGMVLQMMALVPLGSSRSIRRQLHPMTGRD